MEKNAHHPKGLQAVDKPMLKQVLPQTDCSPWRTHTGDEGNEKEGHSNGKKKKSEKEGRAERKH